MAECPEVAPECATTFIPPHLHRAKLALTRYEARIDYGLRDGLQLSLQLPYDIKDQKIRYTTLSGEPYVPPYGDIHHRSETLRGISDPTMSLEWRALDDWSFGLGTTLPMGETVEDPIRLGEEGKRHEHLQFGSGTFQPKLSAQWAHRVDRITLFARSEAKLSLYQSSRGYRPPTTLVWSLGPSISVGRLSFDPRLDGQYQTIGRWHGETDEGSGFNAGGLRLSLTIPLQRKSVVAPAVYRELWSKGFERQTFHQGTTWSISFVRTF